MADRSDYTKSRTNIVDLLSDSYHSKVNESLIENTFNRLLTKDETVPVSGTIGERDAAARVNRQLSEDTVHRQGYQLQPLIHTKIATVDYASSSQDVLNELQRLGVDLGRYKKWGDTERFNFAPPVDLDKLINYTDYYWYDQDDQYPKPQYVVMKNKCSPYTARLMQKRREIAGIGESVPIFNVAVADNHIILLNDVSSSFNIGAVFDISNSFGIDGTYEVAAVKAEGGKTYVTPKPALPSSNYAGGVISFATAISELTQDMNVACEGSAGWDAEPWDDNSMPTEGGVTLADPMHLEYIRETSPDTYAYIKELHPEYFDVDGNPEVTVAQPLWQWLDQPKPEFIHQWDYTGTANTLNDWQIENKWIHKLDLPAGAIAKSTRATIPIIEYLSNLEMNEWTYTPHTWMYREDSVQGVFKKVDVEPTDKDYADPKFLDKWVYVGPANTVPVNHQVQNVEAQLMSIESDVQSHVLTPYIAYKIQAVTSNSVTVSKDLPVFAGQQLVIHTLSGLTNKTILSTTVTGETQVIKLLGTFETLVTTGDFAMVPANGRSYNAVMFNAARWMIALAGMENTRVYVDNREQVANTTELLFQASTGIFCNGVVIDSFISVESQLEIGIDPPAEADKNRALWHVRTAAWIDDQEFKLANRQTTVINPIRYRYRQQHKKVGVTKYPMFDIYYPNGETAFRANQIFKFAEKIGAEINAATGLRLLTANSKTTYSFTQLLLDYDNGPMYCYKDLTDGLYTIWKTSKDVRYTPRYVDEQRHEDGEVFYELDGTKLTASVPYGAGDWEVPSQLNYNASHENRVTITNVELAEHAKKINQAQKTLPGFKENKQYGFRMLENVDYGLSGTIHEHNDSWDLTASALFASTSSPLDILNFAATSYTTALNAQEDYLMSNVYTALVNDSVEYLGNLTGSIVKNAIAAYEANDNNDLIFGDTSSFYKNKGVKCWPASGPVLGVSKLFAPILLKDDKLDIAEIVHHDGHITSNFITQSQMISVAKRVIRTQYKTDLGITRYKGWTPTQAAEGKTKYASYKDIPANMLRPGDCWLNGTEFKRFEVVAVSPLQPSSAAVPGSLWLRMPDYQLLSRTDNTDKPWIPLVVNGVEVPAGETIHAWKTIDLTSILDAIVMEIENRLSAAAIEHKHTELKFPESQYILDEEDKTTYAALLERAFLQFTVDRAIAYPYASVYTAINPFTWNYRGVDANQRNINHETINIWNPFLDGRDVNWKATWQGTYKEVYGTYYPHLEPWVLQGFNSKPSWWDAEYKDTTGTRRWTPTMWTNVVANRVPDQYDAPQKYSVETDPTTMKKYKVMAKIYNYVPVSVTRNVKNSAGVVIYGLDDLFPLHDSRLLDATNIDIVNQGSIGKPMIRRPEAVSGVNFKAAYAFGDYSPIELQWRKSAQFQFDILKIAFTMQPIRFMDRTWGLDKYVVGGLRVNKETNKVFAHQDTVFHGDVIDSQTYISVGLNQWYVNYVRHTGVDLKVSNFRELWTSWTSKLAYQFGGFVNTKSFGVRTAAADLISEDYSIFSKKSPGYDTRWIDALNVTVANYGNSRIRNGVRVPTGDGKDWTFTVSLPAGNSRVLNYFGTRRYTFKVVDEAAGIMELENAVLPWQTGDEVYVDTSLYLPYPMDQVYRYFIKRIDGSNSQFKVSRTKSGANSGDTVILRTSGEGIQYIAETHSTFFAYGGERTDVEWKHHTVDKNAVLQVSTPFVVQGIQSLIDLIDGYVEYKKSEGFTFNDSSTKEKDYNTGRLVSWQTEAERMINTIYTGLGVNNSTVRQYGNTYEIEIKDVNEDPDTFIMKAGVSPFQYADKVYLFTTGSVPGGTSLNTPYFVIPDEKDPTRFRLANTAQNAYDEIAINVTNVGVGSLYVGSFSGNASAPDDIIEVNPFRYNLWIETPQGIVADVFTGGDSYNAGEVLIYDQYGRPLPKGSILVFRGDKVTHVRVRPNLPNDVLINNSEVTPYNLLHLGGMKVYIDGYEHVVIFNNYTTAGQLVYDSYIGMNIPHFTVEFERSVNRNLRPTIGGYFNNGSEMVRNLEASVGDMRHYYRTYDVSENSDYVDYARALLGYEDPKYLDQLNTPRKSKFAFWKGMIQRKGSVNAVDAFINSEHFVDAKVDEFWAYKVADFGDARPRFKPQVRVDVDDSYNNDIRMEFTDVKNPSNDKRFTQITLDTQKRWVNLPTTRLRLNGRNMNFAAKAVTRIVDVSKLEQVATANGVARKLILDQKLFGLTYQYSSNGSWISVGGFASGKGVQNVNDRVKLLYGIDAVTQLYVVGYTPDLDKLDPLELYDTISKTNVVRTKTWNPINGKHYHVADKNIDIKSSVDPVDYATSDWTDEKIGWTWLDTSTVGYVPYDDETVFPEMNDRLERWGRAAEWASFKLYGWTKTTISPLDYTDTQVGAPLAVWTKRNGDSLYDIVRFDPIHSYFNHTAAFAKLSTYDQDLEVSVYVNGSLRQNNLKLKTVGEVLTGTVAPILQYTLAESDYVTITVKPSQDQIDNELYALDYNYVEMVENGETVYYYWVERKTERTERHDLSVAETLSVLQKPQVPYHMFQKYYATEPYTQVIGADAQGKPLTEVVQLPARFTQVIIKDLAAHVTADDRYAIQFTQAYNLRDDLDAGKTPLDLKNKHEEWYLFRRSQPNKVPSALWNKAVEALVGYNLVDIANDVLTPVPSLERVIYDNIYDTTTRFGLEDGQAFVDHAVGLASVERLINAGSFDTTPVDKYVFLDTHSFDTPLNIKNAMNYIFVNFPSEAVNRIFFELLQDALAGKRDYSGIMKTSFIALHGIKVLETAGNVTE